MKTVWIVILIVLIGTMAGQAAEPFTQTVSVAAWPLQVYNALSTDWQFRQWSGAVGATADGRVGGPWRLTYPDGRIEEGLFEITDWPRQLGYSLMIDGTATHVTVAMNRAADSTTVTIHHSWTDSAGVPMGLADSVASYWASHLPLLTAYLNGNPGGYTAVPRGDGPFPAVLILHDRFGLNRIARMRCDSLASLGYLAVAADMFRGEVTGDMAQATRFMTAVNDSESVVAARRAMVYLKNQPKVIKNKWAAWGLGYGGTIALTLATEEPKLKGVALWRSAGRPDDKLLTRIACPVLAIFGDYNLDKPRTEITAFDQALIQHGVRCETVVLSAITDFGDPAYGVGYSEVATNTALEKTLTFFDLNLRPK
jgi:carboxymethylenebutenolidase